MPFVDLMNTQGDAFDALGEPAVRALYPQDHTHFNAGGADLHAATVVALLKGLRPSPVANALSAKGEAVVADKFSWLRLPRSTNPKLPSLIPVGDSTVRNGRAVGGTGAPVRPGWLLGRRARTANSHADWRREVAATAGRSVMRFSGRSKAQPFRFSLNLRQVVIERARCSLASPPIPKHWRPMGPS